MFRRSHVRDDEAVDAELVDREYEEEGPRAAVEPMPFSPAQIVGLIAGLGFTVLGIATVAKLGFDTEDLYQPQQEIWRLPHSPLLGAAEIGLGVLLIIASVVPGGLRSLMAILGVIMLTFGLVILLDASPNDMREWFGVNDSNGWLYTISGSVVALAAMLFPVIVPDRTHRRHREVRQVETVR